MGQLLEGAGALKVSELLDGRRKTEGDTVQGHASVFRRPLSFEVQCWIAWTGLLAFGLRGVLTYREVGAYPPLELGAVVLALCWAIDLVRTHYELKRRA